MHCITTHPEYIQVEFKDNLDVNAVLLATHHVTTLKEYSFTNDLWLIGKLRADIRLGELDMLVQQFIALCPNEPTRTKTAIVVEPGFTQAIMELWSRAIQKKVSFDLRIFSALNDAQIWLEQEQYQVA